MGIIKQKKTNKNLITCFLDEIKNIEIRKKSAYELFNCKKKKKNNENNTSILDINEKIINNENQKNDLIKNSNTNNHLNSNPLTLVKDNILALFPCGPHMPIFDEIDNILRVFHTKFAKIEKDVILSVLNATSFNLEQAFYDLNNYYNNGKPMIYSFTNSEDYIIQHMRNSNEFKELIKKKGINSVIRRIQYFQKS